MTIKQFVKSVTINEYRYARKHPEYMAQIDARTFSKYMELAKRQRAINKESHAERVAAHNAKVDEKIGNLAEHGIHMLYYLFWLFVILIVVGILIAIL